MWNVMVDNEPNQYRLELNILQHENTLWKMIGGNESDQEIKNLKELNVLQHGGFDMEHDRRWLIQSGWLGK